VEAIYSGPANKNPTTLGEFLALNRVVESLRSLGDPATVSAVQWRRSRVDAQQNVPGACSSLLPTWVISGKLVVFSFSP